ncbi:MAG: hypothetical protein GX030_04870 [Firmicutes bacterium]|nr:hypothetical protein [Bacillota bacterium]
MTPRERWQRVMHFQSVDRIPHYEFGYWDELYSEWHEQGLPRSIDNEAQANAYFGFDERIEVGPRLGVIPTFPREVVREEGDNLIVYDSEGVLCAVPKEGSSIPHYLDFPIKDRRTWEEYKHRLDPNDPQRIPSEEELDELAAQLRQATVPVGINIGSLFGKPRDRMGFEGIALMMYDDPELMDEIIETQCRMIEVGIEPYLQRIQFDFAAGWEDICFNNGCIIGPAMFREFLLPRYQRIAKLVHRYGVDVIYTDCDGNINGVVDIWLEAGYNCMFPVEVRAGSDPVELRRRYGKDLLMLGGFDKMALLAGKEAILQELKRLVPIIEEGGYIPHVDHRVPAGVKLEDYKYYLTEKRAVLGF